MFITRCVCLLPWYVRSAFRSSRTTYPDGIADARVVREDTHHGNATNEFASVTLAGFRFTFNVCRGFRFERSVADFLLFESVASVVLEGGNLRIGEARLQHEVSR